MYVFMGFLGLGRLHGELCFIISHIQARPWGIISSTKTPKCLTLIVLVRGRKLLILASCFDLTPTPSCSSSY